MAIIGTVRVWDDEHGVGVIDCPETAGGCWAHFSAIAMGGYRSLHPGQRVELEWESVTDQDGYRFRAVRVWAEGTEPVERPVTSAPDGAYHSELTITFDEGHQQT